MDIKNLQFWTTKSKPWFGNVPGKKIKKEGGYKVYEYPQWDGSAAFKFIQDRLDEGEKRKAKCFVRAIVELRLNESSGEIDRSYVGDYFRIRTKLPKDAYLTTPKDESRRLPLGAKWKVTPVVDGIPTDVVPYLYANYHGADLLLKSDAGVIPEVIEVEAFYLTREDRAKICGIPRGFYGVDDTVGQINNFLVLVRD